MYPIEYVILTLRIYNHANKTKFMNIKTLLPFTGISRKTLYEWKNKYYNDPKYKSVISFISDENKSDDNNIYNTDGENKLINTLPKRIFNRSIYSRKVNDDCIQYIINHTIEKKVINVKKIKLYIKKNFKISISKGKIYHILKENKVSFKKAQKNTYLYDVNKLKEDKERLKREILETNNNLNYTDEMSVCCGLKPDYGWSIKGKDCVIDQPNTYCKRGYDRHSCVMTMTKNKIINYRIKKGSYNAKSFKNYMEHTVNKMGTSTPFMDNAKIHKADILNKYFKKKNIKVIYNVPYSPKFNPIEYVFNTLKEQLKRKMITNISGLRRYLKKYVNEINKKGLEKYCDHATKNLFD